MTPLSEEITMVNTPAEQAIEEFKIRFNQEPEVVAVAPGRVNIIGEHTDYTGGLVLPVAIDKEIVFAVSKTNSKDISGYSLDFQEEGSTKVGQYDPKHPKGWMRYIMGVLSELEKSGYPIGGFQFTVKGTVPLGSGLSSSAAFELSVCTAMQKLFGFSLSGKEAALLCQRAENLFVGVNCGIMDQYISSVGKKDHAVKIDCSDLSTQILKMNTPGYSWIIIASKKQRGLVDSEYNRRREECEEGLVGAQKAIPSRTIRSLRDLTVSDLPVLEKSLDKTVYKRVKHVVTENDRVENTVIALQKGDVQTVGKNLLGSHYSLRDDFEVSCAELDLLVEILSAEPSVAGSRLTGAGFGGCVIALVKTEALDTVKAAIKAKYHSPVLKPGETADIWPVLIADGAHVL